MSSEICFSQYDSIKGYGGFYFGEKIDSVKEKLKNQGIPFDTLTDIFPENTKNIHYSDPITIPINYEYKNYLLKVTLKFDKNRDKLYAANWRTDCFAENINSAQSIFMNFFKIFLEKYGIDYKEFNYLDSLKFFYKGEMYGEGRTLTYVWENTNSQILLKLSLNHFYVLDKSDLVFRYSDSPNESGETFEISCWYVDKNLHKDYIETRRKNVKKTYQEKDLELKKKF